METILLNAEEKMENAITALESRFANVRAGRANPNMLDGISVEYYGTPTPLKSLANISIPEARQLMIKPFDKSILGGIEKAIFEANLGLTPNNNGECIFLVIPPLTEDRRKELVKVVHKKAEDFRVVVRNLRRDANDAIKKAEKAKEITEDESKKGVDDVQKLTDKIIKEIDAVAANKEKEVMEI